MEETKTFVSYFRINNVPILPPLVSRRCYKEVAEVEVLTSNFEDRLEDKRRDKADS